MFKRFLNALLELLRTLKISGYISDPKLPRGMWITTEGYLELLQDYIVP